MTTYPIRACFRKHKISYIKPQYAYFRKLADKEDITTEQQRVSLELAE
jgi:hypothetical protein